FQANRRVDQAERQRDNRRKQIQQTLKSQTDELNARKKRVPLRLQIFQAGMKTTPAAFIRNSVILGAIVFVVCFLVQVPLLFSLVFGIASGYLLPKFYLSRKRKRFQAKFLDELPNAVEAIVRGVKAGL